MCSAVAELLADGGLELSAVTDSAEVIELVKQANGKRPGQAWAFYVDLSSSQAPRLTVGLNGDRGVITWWGGSGTYGPADGANKDPVDYWLGGHHSQLGTGLELPADRALAGLREFLVTGQRPTCIEWVPR